jgi:hypothetical protein
MEKYAVKAKSLVTLEGNPFWSETCFSSRISGKLVLSAEAFCKRFFDKLRGL